MINYVEFLIAAFWWCGVVFFFGFFLAFSLCLEQARRRSNNHRATTALLMLIIIIISNEQCSGVLFMRYYLDTFGRERASGPLAHVTYCCPVLFRIHRFVSFCRPSSHSCISCYCGLMAVFGRPTKEVYAVPTFLACRRAIVSMLCSTPSAYLHTGSYVHASHASL